MGAGAGFDWGDGEMFEQAPPLGGEPAWEEEGGTGGGWLLHSVAQERLKGGASMQRVRVPQRVAPDDILRAP